MPAPPCPMIRRSQMPLKRMNEQTPCGALFDILKRFGGISHKELASMILSERPLADGRSPQSRSSDRAGLDDLVRTTACRWAQPAEPFVRSKLGVALCGARPGRCVSGAAVPRLRRCGAARDTTACRWAQPAEPFVRSKLGVALCGARPGRCVSGAAVPRLRRCGAARDEPPAHQPFGLAHLRGDPRHGVRGGGRAHGACAGGEP